MSGEADDKKLTPVGKRGDWEKGFLWSKWSVLIPLAAGLLVVALLLPQFSSSGWKFGENAERPLKFDNLLSTLPAAVNNKLDSILGQKASNNYTWEELKEAASAAGVAGWRLSTGLSLVVIAVGLFLAGLVIWQVSRGEAQSPLKPLILLILIFALTALALWLWLFPYGKIWPSTATSRQFLGSVQRGMDNGVEKGKRCDNLDAWGCSALVDWELYLTYFGYLMAVYLLCASCAVLRPGRGSALEESEHIAAQMRRLRLLLYVGAVALVVTTLRARMNFGWALAYLPPLSLFAKDTNEALAAAALYQRLDSLVSNAVTAFALLNTIILAIIYVPSALVLRKRAEDVTPSAMKQEARKERRPRSRRKGQPEEKPQTPSRGEWMEAKDLAFPLKDHLARIAAILSPLLAGPFAELLLLLKG